MHLPIASAPRRNAWLTAAMLIVGTLALVAHAYRVGALPKGFYVDELSIGYNAWQIALHGYDEHGVAWPLYFRAFGEYKNPVYIYFLAGIYEVFGLSEATTRAASALAWLFGSAALYALCRRLSEDRMVRLYALICIGFTPWIFSLSRISFEVVSLFPVLALSLWSVYVAYEQDRARAAIVAGLGLGVSMYAYTTFRLLAPLHVLALLLIYAGRPYWRRHAYLLGGFVLASLPLAAYALAHAAHLTGRFEGLTYLQEPGWSVLDKAQAFAVRYLEYFGPDFLGWHGDANPRHHSGYGGELLLATLPLLGIGLLLCLRRRGARFMRVLGTGVLLAPVAAALTRDHAHSLRAFSLAIFAIPLSVAAAAQLRSRFGPAVTALLAACAGIQAGLYLHDYFVRYPARSIYAFETYGLRQALRQAMDAPGGRVVVDERQNQPYIGALFYGELARERSASTFAQQGILIGGESDLRAGDRFVTFDPGFSCMPCRAGLPADSLYGVIVRDAQTDTGAGEDGAAAPVSR